MSHDPEDPVRRAAEMVESWSGVSMSESQMPCFAEDLARLGGPQGATGAIARLAAGDRATREALLDRVTPPETYFFRHPSHFDLLASLARERRAEGRGCNVLSAGCSTGEEAWSAAVVLASQENPYAQATARGAVIGWDLAENRIAQAVRGRYRAWSVRAGLNGYGAFFRRHGDVWEVEPRVRELVRFEQRNLLDAGLPWPGRFDAILLRNVAIYWGKETVERACENLARLLAPDGVLLVGPCDPWPASLAGWQSEFLDGGRAHRPPRAAPLGQQAPAPRPSARPPARPLATPSLAAPSLAAPSLAAPSLAAPSLAAPSLAAPLAWQPAAPLAAQPAAAEASSKALFAELEALAARGAYAEALEQLRSRGPASVLARRHEGVLLLHLGRETEALALFRQCVFLEPEEPGHRRWLAVGLAAVGRDEDAQRENRNALALER